MLCPVRAIQPWRIGVLARRLKVVVAAHRPPDQIAFRAALVGRYDREAALGFVIEAD
jgi:hypothetical protein